MAFAYSLARIRAGHESLRLIAFAVTALLAASVAWAGPQTEGQGHDQVAAAPQQEASQPTSLADLIEEARKNDPAIQAAGSAARAANFAAPQMSALPDPQFTVQQLSVGSPRPFAGYTNSDFAYIGVGASQQIPYPGKLKLRGNVAERDADVAKAHVSTVEQDEIETLKTTYIHLAYLQQTLDILQRHAALLQQIEQETEAHYSAGQGNQQDVLKSQLERTKILGEISMHHESMGEDQAALKRILGRSQDSPDITTSPLAASFLRYTASELLAKVRGQNADVQQSAAAVQRNQAAVDVAQKDFRPDFDLAYMYENTDPKFRDYYMLTISVNFPRRKPRQAALAQAQANVETSQHEQAATTQTALAEVQKQYVAVKSAEEQLLIYRDGLIPQAQAAIQAGLAAYQSNRADFQNVFSSYSDLLNLDLEYQQTLLDHETALAHIEKLTGVSLP